MVVTSMDQNEWVIFAELRRSDFELVVSILSDYFPRLEWGSQCDDWLWIYRQDYKLEIDSFSSMELEVKGPRKASGLAQEVLSLLPPSVFLQVFERPKLDFTR
ncbi:hypothetical protein IQ219_06075 [Synechocystis sp. LEGE 06083]|uniref:hypothetical protein n=1 Tax=Synechocystis sp. LEGE 06083 TaxID=915336 RepID=UPI0018807E87|nr:hypothetical protein [Synechocystis sp. LEGE 06083]MBE9194883.1 hypothetical protein [Synechocystis sp. LEGE 06083]